MPKESFADRLRAAMEKQNMKQVDLVRAAASAGVKLGKAMSASMSVENCSPHRYPDFLAQTLHTDSEWLLGHDQDSAFSEFSTAGFQTDARKNPLFTDCRISCGSPGFISCLF